MCHHCRKGPEPEEMDKDMILQEKEAEVGYFRRNTTDLQELPRFLTHTQSV